ncbi:MAG: DoxX family protein [Planctomycetota bacterium]|nr:DoxX family protein [Planctomycetota bacterium]
MNQSHCMVGYYERFAHFMDKGQSGLLLLIRVYIGYQCALAGYNHLTNYRATVEAFKGWNVPMPEINVAIAATTELVGGTFLLLGFMARLISVPLMFNFIVAILAVNLAEPRYREMLKHLWDNQAVVIKDDAFPFLATAVLILFMGPGHYSIDWLIHRHHHAKPEVSRQGFEVRPTTSPS